MKLIYNYSLLLAVCLSMNLNAQHRSSEVDRWSLGARISHLYDIGAYRYDTELSRDMRGLNGDFTTFDIGFSFYAERMFNPIFGLQLAYAGGSMTGANDVEYYENSFSEARLDFIIMLSNWSPSFANSPWNVYTRLGLANGNFIADQFLQADQVGDNSFEDTYWKYQGGLGIQYELNPSWRLELDLSLNSVLNDGFDGYNSASGSDVYWSTGIGLAYSIGPALQKPVYQQGLFNREIPRAEAPVQKAMNQDSAKIADLDEKLKSLEDQVSDLKAQNEALAQELKNRPAPKANASKLTQSSAVFFAFDSAYLSATARKQILSEWAMAWEDPSFKIKLKAYADGSGPEAYNRNLKQLRAEAVRDFLMEMGLKANQIEIEIAEPTDGGSSYLNRRVELVGKV